MNYYQNMYPYNQGPAPTPMMSQQTSITRVTGENGARAYQLAPNSSVLLLDDTAPIVWLVQTDGAGYKTLNPYSITPYQAEPKPDYRSLEDRIRRLEDAINGKPDTVSTKRNNNSGRPE